MKELKYVPSLNGVTGIKSISIEDAKLFDNPNFKYSYSNYDGLEKESSTWLKRFVKGEL